MCRLWWLNDHFQHVYVTPYTKAAAHLQKTHKKNDSRVYTTKKTTYRDMDDVGIRLFTMKDAR